MKCYIFFLCGHLHCYSGIFNNRFNIQKSFFNFNKYFSFPDYKTDELEKNLNQRTDNIEQALSIKTDNLVSLFNNKSGELDKSVKTRLAELDQIFNKKIDELHNKASVLNDQISSKTSGIEEEVRKEISDMTEKVNAVTEGIKKQTSIVINTWTKENGVEMTEEQAKTYFAELNKEGELSDDELENVAGAGCDSVKPAPQRAKYRGKIGWASHDAGDVSPWYYFTSDDGTYKNVEAMLGRDLEFV